MDVFYDEHLAPYNREPEGWCAEPQSLWLACKLLALTALVILLQKNQFYRQQLRALPEPALPVLVSLLFPVATAANPNPDKRSSVI